MAEKRNSIVLVAIGANLPGADGAPPIVTCRAAVAALAVLPGLRLMAVSRFFATPAEPLGSGAPDFVNAVARLDGPPGDPEALLTALHGIEATAGRTRSVPNAPRPLDLDLIDAWGLVVNSPGLALPHPRAAVRRFVLVPLLDVAPDWRHPISGVAGSALLTGLPSGPLPRPLLT